MNHPSSPSILSPSHPLTDRVLAELGDSLRLATHALLSRWRDYRARRQEARALTGIREMDLHMLRDIGAPEHLIARAAEGRSAYHRDGPRLENWVK